MKGVYCLLLNIKKDVEAEIGALGRILFEKGTYIYVGSAQNNMEKRIARHCTIDKKIRWHIDYLLAHPDVEIEKILYKIAGRDEECITAQILSKNGEPVKRFGSSDCKCQSHLFKVKSIEPLEYYGFKEM